VARFQAGWGRFKYVNDQMAKYRPDEVLPKGHGIPKWNSDEHKVREYSGYLEAFEKRDVYFSYPLDLDFAMLLAYPDAYGVEEEVPDAQTIKAVLGKSHHDSSQYSEDELKLFGTYHQRFKLGSKPAAHIDALAQLSDEELLEKMPESFSSLVDAVIAKLLELPE
jgi:putative ATP-dependent endonuclease of OLD family